MGLVTSQKRILIKLCIWNCQSGKSQETLHKAIALNFNFFWALLPLHWFEYFLAQLFSQAGLESLDVICA